MSRLASFWDWACSSLVASDRLFAGGSLPFTVVSKARILAPGSAVRTFQMNGSASGRLEAGAHDLTNCGQIAVKLGTGAVALP